MENGRWRRLAGRVALVTGAARGIGAGGPRALAAAVGEQALYVHLDVRDQAAWGEAIRAARDRFGTAPTILVHNAGVMVRGTAEHADEAGLRFAFEVNVLGPALGTSACVPGMRAAGGGAIVLVSSIAALSGGGGLLSVASSTAGNE